MITGLEFEVAESLKRLEAEYLWMQALSEMSELESPKHVAVQTEYEYSTVASTLGCWQLGPC